METQRHELVISYRSVDDERVSSFKDIIEETLGEQVCAKLASDTIVKEEQYSYMLASCRVFILMCSSSYAQIDDVERKRISDVLKYLSAQEDKSVVFVTLDSPEVPDWLEEIMPRQQVTALSNQHSLDKFFETLRDKIQNSDLDKKKALPKGVFKVGNLYYRAVREGNVVEVAPEFGDKLPEERFIRYFGDKDDLAELVIPDKISYGGYEYNVVGIGRSAFSDSYGYQAVVIPDTVEYIGEWAFCESNLVSIESSVFSDCPLLTTVIIPSGIERIGEGAFKSCAITHAAIPDTVTSIGPDAFGGLLQSINVDERNPKYDSRDECNAIIETETDTLIAGCYGTMIPRDITTIDFRAFEGIPIEFIDIPEGVTVIGSWAFHMCENLLVVTLPSGLNQIGTGAFNLCKSLLSINIPRGTKEKYMMMEGLKDVKHKLTEY